MIQTTFKDDFGRPVIVWVEPTFDNWLTASAIAIHETESTENYRKRVLDKFALIHTGQPPKWWAPPTWNRERYRKG